MASKNVALFFWLISGALAIADEPQASNEPSVKELLAKIEKLEQRVMELEAAQLPPTVYYPVPTGSLPGYRVLPPAKRLLDTQKSAPNVIPRSEPFRAPLESVPSSWHRHEFNGYFYYTIPLGSSKSTPMVY